LEISMSRFISKRAVLALTAVVMMTADINLHASTKIGGQLPGRPNPNYNYSPSVIQTGNIQQFWWCGQAPNPANPSQNTDTIQYYSVNLQTQATVGPETVLAETPGTWDSQYTCNPKVVKGTFTNPLGNGLTYTYALYYVATDNFIGMPNQGDPNSIGVAFSNDGINWTKYPNPVITYSAQDKANGWYGVGQPAVYNSNGVSAIRLFYEGHSLQAHYEATSTDGVHFTYQGELATNGLDQVEKAGRTTSVPPDWGDMAYDPETGYWYAAFNMTVRPPSTTGSVPERGNLGIIIYRILNSSLLTGATHWDQVATIDTNLTGFESNFIAGFLRDPNGNINVSPYYPNIVAYTSVSSPRPVWNATPAIRGSSGDVTHWNLLWDLWTPNALLIPFKRYSGGGTYEVTTGYVDTSVFSLQSTLGYLYESPQGAATQALYGCVQGPTDYFISTDSACEGQLFLGINGYSYPTDSEPNLVQIYRCYNGVDHFVSTDPDCEGSTEESSLGFIPTSQ
jgi:hypothetical protein